MEDENEEFCECCGARIEKYVYSPTVLKDLEPLEDLVFPPNYPKDEKERVREIISKV